MGEHPLTDSRRQALPREPLTIDEILERYPDQGINLTLIQHPEIELKLSPQQIDQIKALERSAEENNTPPYN